MNQQIEQIDKTRLPRHIAIIMDGNGRWAKSHGNERSSGHVAGVESVRNVITAASSLGVGYLTLYAFSTENWNRPRQEVELLLSLIVTALADETENLVANNVRLCMIGDMERLPETSRTSLEKSMAVTARCTGLQVNLAISYSSRWEITEAVRKIAARVASGDLSEADIDEAIVSSYLATAGMPDPDLMIRTGGDYRISNFLLWQIAYSELYFTDIFWPEFGEESLFRAIIEYQKRERRFGMTSEQIMNKK